MLNFDKMPDEAFAKPKEGIRDWEITSCELATSKSSGSHMLVFGYTSLDKDKVKVNYDNCPIEDAQGNPIAFGQAKLKKILSATGVRPEGDFLPRILPKLLIGKHLSFKASYARNDKYLGMDNIDSILPVKTNSENVTPEMFMEQRSQKTESVKKEIPSFQEVDINDEEWEVTE